MVPNNHKVAHLEVIIDSSDCIGNKQFAYAKRNHHPHRQYHCLCSEAFIIMITALHSHHLLSGHGAEYEIALVAQGCGSRHSWQVGVIDNCLSFNLVHELAQSAAQNDTGFRAEIPDDGLQPVRNDFYVFVFHIITGMQ